MMLRTDRDCNRTVALTSKKATATWVLGFVVATILLQTVDSASSLSTSAQQSKQQPLFDSDFGVSSYIFTGEWKQHAYQANIQIRAVCQGESKHVRLVISITTTPHPYFLAQRHFEWAVTPDGWFTYGEGGIPRIWFQDYTTGNRTIVTQHLGETEVDGAWLFDGEYWTQSWLGSTNLEQDNGYTLHIQGSQRSYQAVPPGPCLPVHNMFLRQVSATAQVRRSSCSGKPLQAGSSAVQFSDGNDSSSPGSGSVTADPSDHGNTMFDDTANSPPIWMAVVQKVVFAKHHMAYIVKQHLDYHLKLGMAGMLMVCDFFVCLELLQDPILAARAAEGKLALWAWAVGNEIDKPHHKLHVAQDLMRTAAYGTPALLTFYDLDEFLVIPSGQPITSLLAQGGCLAGVRTHKQVLIRSKITVASNWSNTDPGVVGELPGWLVHDVWIDALEALDYSMAPQGFLGWKAIVDPNTDYNFNCHEHVELHGMLDIPQVNFVEDSCAFNMHFTNWFSDRISSPTVGGAQTGFSPLGQPLIATLRALYQRRLDPSVSTDAVSNMQETEDPDWGQASAKVTFRTAADLKLRLQAGRDKPALKVVSVTLVTGPAEILLGEALSSASPLVDACLVVYPSSVSSIQRSLAAAGKAVGDKLIIQEIAHEGLGEMLNASLAWASQLGAEWAVLLGPDQRISNDSSSGLQQEIADAVNSEVTQHNCYHTSLDYLQAFLVKLSADGGFVHDQYVQPNGLQETSLPGCSISRPSKTKEWRQRRAQEAMTQLEGTNGAAGDSHNGTQAAWFALAEAWWELGQQQRAVEAWQSCAGFSQSRELAALCGYRLALLAVQAGVLDRTKALENLQRVVDAHGCDPELCWYAALTAYHAGKYDQSRELALQAVQTGCHTGICMPEGRVRYIGARYELPFDVLRFALAQLGDWEGAQQAQANAEQAYEKLHRTATPAVTTAK